MINRMKNGAVSGTLNLPIEALIIFSVFIIFFFLKRHCEEHSDEAIHVSVHTHASLRLLRRCPARNDVRF